MKLSISLRATDVAFLDEYATSHGLGSRSAAMQKAVQLLRADELGPAYTAAWHEWDDSEDAALWESTAEDGLRERP